MYILIMNIEKPLSTEILDKVLFHQIELRKWAACSLTILMIRCRQMKQAGKYKVCS